MRHIALLPTVAALLTGCTLIQGVNNEIGWKDVSPPISDGVGRRVDGKGLSQQAFVVTPDMLETLDSYDTFSTERQNSFNTGLDLAIRGVTAKANLSFIGSNNSTSHSWKIVQLKNFQSITEDTWFAYSCLTAGSYKYTVSRKTTAGLTLDAAELAQKFGATAAKVEIGVNPSKPDTADITLNNPNVCLAYKSAKFSRAHWFFNRWDKPRKFMAGTKVNFYLSSSNMTIAKAEPDFAKRATHSKPTYYLYAVKNGDMDQLVIKVIDPAMFPQGLKIPLTEAIPGRWSGKTYLPTFKVGNNLYGFMSAEIEATRESDGTIQVTSADLYSPEFTLKTR